MVSVLVVAVLAVAAPSLFDDPRIAEWNRLAQHEDVAPLLESVAKDLASAKPHPFALHVEKRAYASIGKVAPARPGLVDIRALAAEAARAIELECDYARAFQLAMQIARSACSTSAKGTSAARCCARCPGSSGVPKSAKR